MIAHEHQLRITIVGAENPTFAARGPDIATKITIHYGPEYPSSLTVLSHVVPLSLFPAPVKPEKDGDFIMSHGGQLKKPAAAIEVDDEFAQKSEL
jgi:hypothetical protein